MKEVTEFDLIKLIKKVNGIIIKGKSIYINLDNHGAGKGTWKKIEVLEKTFGYLIHKTNNLDSKSLFNNKYEDNQDNTNRISKEEKREKKFKVKLPKMNFKKL